MEQEIQNGKARVKFIEKCYRLYEQKMYQAAYRILHDCGLAEDAVQEAFLKLMKSRICFGDAESDDCKKYLITVIRHAAIDIYHKKRKEQAVVLYDEAVYGKTADLRYGCPEDEKEKLKELISGLPSRYCEVVDCLVIQSLSVRETAGKLGITEANVRKRFERSKKMLKHAGKGNGAL